MGCITNFCHHNPQGTSFYPKIIWDLEFFTITSWGYDLREQHWPEVLARRRKSMIRSPEQRAWPIIFL